MKKWILFLLTLAGTIITVWAQDLAPKEVPAPVASAFKSKYAGASDTKWKLTKSGNYEADFKWEGKKAEAKFAKGGQWLSSEVRIAKDQVPAGISAYLKQHYAGHEVDKVRLKEESEPAKKQYEVDLKKGTAGVELIFDENGSFLKKKDKKAKA